MPGGTTTRGVDTDGVKVRERTASLTVDVSADVTTRPERSVADVVGRSTAVVRRFIKLVDVVTEMDFCVSTAVVDEPVTVRRVLRVWVCSETQPTVPVTASGRETSAWPPAITTRIHVGD